jgi:outer membrane lipoprotein SlyB
MIRTRTTVLVTLASATLLAACASPDPYNQNVPAYTNPPTGTAPYSPPYEARGRVVQPVAYNTGVVSSIELMRAEGPSRVSPAGVIAGAVIGGLLGNQIGAGSGKAAATVAGVAAGGYAGNEIGRRAQAGSAPDIYRIAIQYDGGGSQYIDVGTPGDLRVGDRVRVDANGQIGRF